MFYSQFCKTFHDDCFDEWIEGVADNYYRKDIDMTKKYVENNTGVDVIINGKKYTSPEVTFISNHGERPRVNILGYIPVNPNVTITNVIFNPPATIVFWSDKTKTVVKCDEAHELYDPEKGLAMAISRKMIGDNKREYYNTFLHWLKKWEKTRTLDDMYTEEEWNGEMYNV